MYISKKAAFMRNVAIAAINGIITLILLLIAPLGLFGVIVNTALVTVSTFLVASLMDVVTRWLILPATSARNIPQWQQAREFNSSIKEIDRAN